MGNNNSLRPLCVVALAACFWVTSCNKSRTQPATQQNAAATDQTPSSDPAQANSDAPTQLPDTGQSAAPASSNTSQAAAPQPQSPASQPQSASYPQAAAPQAQPVAQYSQNSQPLTPTPQEQYEYEYGSAQSAPAGSYPPVEQPQPLQTDDSQDTSAYAAYQQPIQVDQPPPPLPDYSQPPCPGDNYIWTPGYWGHATGGYYWVPGVWVVAPYVGALWTPPFWGYAGNRYAWHAGYWGPHIGFYGGINYGHGYVGRGYEGGYWNHDRFAYNREVTNVNTTVVHNVYNYKVVNITNTRVSYNGGNGGVQARPTSAEYAVLRERRVAPVPAQITLRSAADREPRTICRS